MYTIISHIVKFLLNHLPCQWTTDSHEVDCFTGSSFCGATHRSAFVMEMEIFELHLFPVVFHVEDVEGREQASIRLHSWRDECTFVAHELI